MKAMKMAKAVKPVKTGMKPKIATVRKIKDKSKAPKRGETRAMNVGNKY